MRILMVLLLSPFVFAACGKGFATSDLAGSSNGASSMPGGGNVPAGVMDWADEKVALDSFGENFAKSIATQLKNSHYMEKNCVADFSFTEYGDLPVERCRYTLNGQKAEVAMLNPGARRMTAWLVDACSSSSNLSNCVQKSYNQILNQSGGQFPVLGIVIEDMDGNGAGNAYAFREGVTVRVPSFGTGTESLINDSQISASFTDDAMYSYSYGRPISVTRPQLQTYAASIGLSIPNLGTSAERLNIFNVVIGQMYRESWMTGRSHIIRAWVKAQGL